MTLRSRTLHWPSILFFAVWTVFFTVLFWGLVRVDAFDNLELRHSYAWADWAAHFTMGSSFGYRAWWLDTSPLVIDQKLSYPFAINFISGLLIRWQVPFFWAFVIPSWVGAVLGVVLLYRWYFTWLKSRTQAALASTLFLLNGGLGFVIFTQRVRTAVDPWHTFLNPGFDLTNLESEGIRWISVINSMIVPQRAFVLGLPVGLLLLWCFYQLVSSLLRKSAAFSLNLHSTPLRLAFVCGSILGLLPLIHTHTFLAMVIILSCWSLGGLWAATALQRKTLFLHLVLTAVMSITIATPILLTIYAGHVSSTFLKWYPGWLATEFSMNWFWFWLKNWGLTPLLGVGGMILFARAQKVNRFQKTLAVPFLLLFILSNLFLFQPWSWDNTKLLIWSSVGFSGYAVYCLARLWQLRLSHQPHWHQVFKRSLVVLTFITLIASGGIDAWQSVRPGRSGYVMYTTEELALAEWVKQNTDPNSVWLTSNRHNHWLFNLTGRQAVMTYPGWLWSQGYDYSQVERDSRSMWQQPDQLALYDKYRVQYVVVETSQSVPYNVASFASSPAFRVVHTTNQYTIYQRLN